jgi:hypothetical protein
MSEIRTEEAMRAEAAAKGLRVVFPTDHELFIDIDSALSEQVFTVNLALFKKFHMVAKVKKTPSASGKPHHFHIVVTLLSAVPDAVTRITWQAILGSDPKRELLALEHLKEGRPPTVFFEKPPPVVKKPSGRSVFAPISFCDTDDEEPF